MQMARSRGQSIKCKYFKRLANQESVILPSLRKNTVCLNQSAISSFALYVIRVVKKGLFWVVVRVVKRGSLGLFWVVKKGAVLVGY